MICLKKIDLNLDEKQQFETALRKAALKRHTSLDFKSSVSNIGTDKLFLGYEGKDNVQFTRLRSSLEKFLPKIIITISKNSTDNYIKLRYSILPFTLMALLTIGFLGIMTSILISKGGFERIIPNLIFIGIFIILTLSELKITERKISKAVNSLLIQQKSPA